MGLAYWVSFAPCLLKVRSFTSQLFLVETKGQKRAQRKQHMNTQTKLLLTSSLFVLCSYRFAAVAFLYLYPPTHACIGLGARECVLRTLHYTYACANTIVYNYYY